MVDLSDVMIVLKKHPLIGIVVPLLSILPFSALINITYIYFIQF